MLSISGLHVAILAGGLLLAARLAGLARRRAVPLVAALVVTYTLASGAEPPAVRAMVLVLLYAAAHRMGRPRLSFNMLAAAGLVVLAWNPTNLFNTGAQLSFLAVAGLMGLSRLWSARHNHDPLDRVIEESRGTAARAAAYAWRELRVATLSTAAIWLLTLPLVVARFNLVTPIALAVNPLACVPLGLAMVSGFGVLCLGWLLPPLGAVLGWVCGASLACLSAIIETAARVPHGYFFTPAPADWWIAGLYAGLALTAALPRLRPRPARAVALVAGWCAVGLAAAWLRPNPARLECTFLSVGHGAAIVLRLPTGQTLLYDAGQFSSPQGGATTIARCLWSRGIRRIDGVILSHADADHYNALPALLERFSVDSVYVSPTMFNEPNDALRALRAAIEAAGAEIRTVTAGHRLADAADCRITVLHPAAAPAGDPSQFVLPLDDNSQSIVLTVESAGRRILLPADLSSPGLDELLAGRAWDCDVLLAPHHGSQQSDPPGLAAWAAPEWVVISGSRRYDIDETKLAYHLSGAKILHTADCGAVTVSLDAHGLTVETFLDPAGRLSGPSLPP